MEKDGHLQDSTGINAPHTAWVWFLKGTSPFYLLKPVLLTHGSLAFSDLLLRDKKHPFQLLIACRDFSLETSAFESSYSFRFHGGTCEKLVLFQPPLQCMPSILGGSCC